MTTNPELETERELRIAAEKNYNDLLAFLRGEPPERYCLHVRGHADEIRKLHGNALTVAAQNADAAKMAEMERDNLRDLLQQMLNVAMHCDETGYAEGVGFVDLGRLHTQVREALG